MTLASAAFLLNASCWHEKGPRIVRQYRLVLFTFLATLPYYCLPGLVSVIMPTARGGKQSRRLIAVSGLANPYGSWMTMMIIIGGLLGAIAALLFFVVTELKGIRKD